MNIEIRQANESDYKEIEFLTREAFWNVYKPGCDEHLVVHNMHKNNASIKELELVALEEGKIVGHIMYSKGSVDGFKNSRLITLGPISVDINLQKNGIGSALINESLKIAKDLGYEAVLLTGNPDYYRRFGFTSASKFNIYFNGIPLEDEAPFFMAFELYDKSLQNLHGDYIFDKSYDIDESDLAEFEKNFPYKVKEVRPGQL